MKRPRAKALRARAKKIATRVSAILAMVMAAMRVAIGPLVSLLKSLWSVLAWLVAQIVTGARWLLVPKPPVTLFETLKHYISLIVALMGFTALLWAAKQIAYPPIVITVAKLPLQLETENWINPEIQRALMDQIERMRSVVKGERDPAFEAVLNPPNIIIKSGDWSFNIQEQLLTPLGSLLGRSQGEVHLVLTCYHPGCARASDSECRDPIPAPKPEAAPAAGASPPPKQYLCLRVTADIRRASVHRRITPRLTLSNDTYDADTTKQMAKIAEEVTSVADPATAALYFYRRVKQEGAASGSFTNDPDLISDLRGEAFKAAEEAEVQDAGSACWAHSVRAHLAIDSNEFGLAETYITRAKEIPWWRHLRQFRLPIDCRRLVVLAEIALARRLAIESEISPYPPYDDNTNRMRRQAAYKRITDVLTELGAEAAPAWAAMMKRSYIGSDLAEAAAFARAEVGLHWFSQKDQCALLRGGNASDAAPLEDFDVDPDGVDAEDVEEILKAAEVLRAKAWSAIQGIVADLQALKPARPLPRLVRQAALDFVERLLQNHQCLARLEGVAKQLYLSHPNDSEVVKLVAGLIETIALVEAKSEEQEGEEERKRAYLTRVRGMYERMSDIGDDKTDIFALGRLALINMAFDADFEAEEKDLDGPPKPALRNVTRAWNRFQRQLSPTDVRHHAEIVLSFWGSLLLSSYPQGVVTADLSKEIQAADLKEKMRDAKAKAAEFQRAVQILFPTAQSTKLSDFPKLSGIGTRIGCICILTRMTGSETNTTEFFLNKVNRWQQNTRVGFRSFDSCARDVLPPRRPVHPRVRFAAQRAKTAFDRAKAAVDAASPPTSEVKVAFEKADAAFKKATADLDEAQKAVEEATKIRKKKEEKLAQVAKLCHVPLEN